MANSPNPFVWYELMTTDADAAKAFYGAALGWDAQEWGGKEFRYLIMSAGEKMVAGMMPMPADMWIPACWRVTRKSVLIIATAWRWFP